MPVNGIGGASSNNPLDELRGRAARRRAYESEQRAAGRSIPGATSGTGEAQKPGQQSGYRYTPAGAVEHESTYTSPAGGFRPQGGGTPDRTPKAGGVDPKNDRLARQQFLRGMREGRDGRDGQEKADQAQAEPPEADARRAEGRDRGRADRRRRAGQAGANANPGIDPKTGMINRSRARAATARAQQMAAGGTQTTGEDLERMNREANAEARQQYEAQQLAARQSGRISHGSMTPSYDRPQSPHGGGHEYMG